MKQSLLTAGLLTARVLGSVIGTKPAAGNGTANPQSSLSSPPPGCKCFPGDDCWPTDAEWSALNTTVHGRLIATVPLALDCHGSAFDPAGCKTKQTEWQDPTLHMADSASIMAPFFANQSCDPFTATSWPCHLGNYVRYAVAAESADDIMATVKFAKQHNIRFVIRNTGHDYNGRSTGAGALSVWTRKMKSVEWKSWNDQFYKGTAVKVGAGIQGTDLLEQGRSVGQIVVSGECPTVGPAGGYTQGGGHSAISTSFGLSADNTLEWEVVTAAGELITASRTQNTDMYWALSGGGGGNYGVVVSMTVKTFPDSRFGAATLNFVSDSNPTETFYKGIDAFHAALPAMVESGALVVYYFTKDFFKIAPLTAYNQTADQVQAIMNPLLKSLDGLGVKYNVSVSQKDNYYEHFDEYFGPLPNSAVKVGIAQYGGRLIPKSTFTDTPDALSQVSRYLAEKDITFIGVGTDVSPFGKDNQNAVLPAWRKALVHATLTTEWSFDPAKWDKMMANQDLMTNDIMPRIESITPNSGAYMNEADFRQPNFQQAFFGANYGPLVNIKRKYDPDAFFYALNAVDSEQWSVSESGRMCRV